MLYGFRCRSTKNVRCGRRWENYLSIWRDPTKLRRRQPMLLRYLLRDPSFGMLPTSRLTHYGLMTPFGVLDLYQQPFSRVKWVGWRSGAFGVRGYNRGTVLPHNTLTHWGRDKIVAIYQTTFSNAFSWIKMHKFQLKFHWDLFPRVQLTIFHHCFR